MRSWVGLILLCAISGGCSEDSNTSWTGDHFGNTDGGIDSAIQAIEMDADPQDTAAVERDAGGIQTAYVAIGHRMSNEIGVPGRAVTVFQLSTDSEILSFGERFELPHPVTTLDFVGQSGKLLVASENAELSLFDVTTPVPMRLDGADIEASGVVAVRGHRNGDVGIVSRDSSASGGIYFFRTSDLLGAPTFLPMTLAYATARCDVDNRWLIIGGQATFEPIMNNDAHLVSFDGESVETISASDLTPDILETAYVALTDDCRYALYGNRSIFSDTFGRLFLVELAGDEPRLVEYLDTGEDLGQIHYVAHLDLFVVSSFESERLSTYRILNGRLEAVDAVERQGLVSGIAVLPTASGAQLVIGSIHASQGSRLGLATLDAEGRFGDVRWRSLGEGGENIPSVLASSGWIWVQE